MPESASPPGDVHAVALRMLARRSYSCREIAEKLTRKGFSGPVIAAEIRRLERAGLLDEAELARAVRRAELRRGVGRRGVAAALRRRKLGEEPVAAALAGVSPDDEREALGIALDKAVRRYAGSGELPRMRRKVIRYLLTRSFPAAEVIAAVGARLGESDDAEEAVELADPPDVP
ncbi:MAG: RecX family transcriptional regulator [Acidobacteria bacterium]|nr:RecX family transcriptional regulator [Acidobacteriota bacterium]